MTKASIIISSFNRLDLLRPCLAAFGENLPQDVSVELNIVDDGSTDGTREWLQASCPPGWQVVLNESNLGYAASHNRAVERARSDILVLVNGDLVVRPLWLEPILATLDKNPEAFAVGNRQITVENAVLDHAGITFLPGGTPDHVRDEFTKQREFTAVTFACAAVRKDKFLALGGFDESYRNGVEDIDLCLRARMRGWPCFVAHESVVDHHVSASPGRKDAESEYERLFQRRWNNMAVQWGRDWDERVSREKAKREIASAGNPTRRTRAVRVLVDCSAVDGSRSDEFFPKQLEVLKEIQQRAPGQCDFHGLVAPGSGVAEYLAGKSLTVWMLPGANEAELSHPKIRRLTDVGTSLARSLRADLLYLPFGETVHVCPDVPIVSTIREIPKEPSGLLESVDRLARVSYAIECGSAEVSAILQKNFLRSADSLFIAESVDATATRLADIFQEAVNAFSGSEVAWRWDPAAGAVVNLLPARDAGKDEVLLQVDEPMRWDNPVPLLQIRGWCLSNRSSPVATVFGRSVDGAWEGVYGLARPDVAAAFPARDEAGTSGFLLRLPRPTQVPSPISIEVRFADGYHAAVLRPVVE